MNKTTFKPNIGITIMQTLLFATLLSLPVIALALVFMLTEYANPFYGYILLAVILPLIIFFSITSIGNVMNTTYEITNKFITRKKKFISEIQEDIPLSQITNIDYRIGWFFDKIFGVGTILVYTSGSGSFDITLSNIKSVADKYEQINDLLKLNKSVKLHSNGEILKNRNTMQTESKLLERIKPSAGIATFQLAIGNTIFWIYVTGFLAIIIVPIVTILSYIAWTKKYYDFYTDKVEYYDGFLTLNKSTVTMERITNISENRGILDRLFGTYTINIETAGSARAEVSIKYVKDGTRIVENLKEVLKVHGTNWFQTKP